MSVLSPAVVSQTLSLPVKLLGDWLKTARPFISAAAAYPALECVRLICDEEGLLTMTAGDGQSVLTLTTTLDTPSPFALCLPHKPLDAFIATLTDEVISLTSSDDKGCRITYQGGTIRMAAEPAVDYPQMTIGDGTISWDIEGESSATLAHYLGIAVRYTMKPDMLGSDAHRCAWITPSDNGADLYASSSLDYYLLAHPPIERPPLCIPWPSGQSDKYLPILERGELSTISLNQDRSWLTVRISGYSASVRLYNLPDSLGETFYQNGTVINMKNMVYPSIIRGNSVEWAGCIKRIKALPQIDKLGNLMSLRWTSGVDGNGTLTMAADDTVGDYELKEELDVAVEGELPAEPKGFRVPLLLDVLGDLGKGLIELHTGPQNNAPLSLRNPANPTLQIVLLNIQVK